jgi:uncharacterized protein YkwD
MAVGVNRAETIRPCFLSATAARHWHLGCFMEIMKPLVLFLQLVFGLFSPFLFADNLDLSPGDSDRVTSTAIIHEINIARQNPTLYATFLERTRQNYAGRVRLMPGSIRLCTHEGVRAVDEAIRFLRRARPLPPLALSLGLCSAAAAHCREQASGAVGHHACDGSDPGNRLRRYGVVAQGWAENIAYGQRSARATVMALIIDDGVRGRSHRRNIFNSNYNAVGAAYGPHARYGSVCSIDFVSGYAEGTFVRAGSKVANSF